MMNGHIMDSDIYGHLWGTDAMRARLSDAGRVEAWLDILRALASAQAELDLIPRAAAAQIEEELRPSKVDLAAVSERTRATGHSTLGLIEVIQQSLPPLAAEWVYYGATVQDITDTWTAMTMRDVLHDTASKITDVAADLAGLAEAHRTAIAIGRTHGQPGQVVTFGFKAAGWAAELRRHGDRARELTPRVAVGQLGGAVGAGAFFGEAALELRRRFCTLLGLGEPDFTWLTARDRVAEFVVWLAMVTGTLARIGRDVYNLQRPEINELREGYTAGVVGSITMPHKRNPEIAEHLITLSRVVRANAALALEGMVQEHERDGAAWKVEWLIVPEACLAAAACTWLAKEMIDRLEVDTDQMSRNVAAHNGYLQSEEVMRALVPAMGKHRARALVHEVSHKGRSAGLAFGEALKHDPQVTRELSAAEIDALLEPERSTSGAVLMVDAWLTNDRS